MILLKYIWTSKNWVPGCFVMTEDLHLIIKTIEKMVPAHNHCKYKQWKTDTPVLSIC